MASWNARWFGLSSGDSASTRVGGIVTPLDRLVAGRQVGHPDAVLPGQQVGDPGGRVADGQIGLGEDLLGGQVEGREVVPPGVEQLLHFLLGQRRWHRHRAHAAGVDAVDQRLVHVPAVPEPPVQLDDITPDGRHGRGQLADLRHRDLLADRRVGQHVTELGDQPVGVFAGELLQVGVEDAGQLQQHGGGHRALAGLQLVHVARGDAQRAGQCRLGQAAFLAEAAQPDAHPGFRDRHHTPSFPPVTRQLNTVRNRAAWPAAPASSRRSGGRSPG